MKSTYGKRESRNTKTGSSRKVPSLPAKLGHGKDPVQSSGIQRLPRDLPSVANLFPVDISKRTNPEEQGLEWKTLDEVDTSLEYLFPDSDLPCPVEKKLQLPSEQQEHYIYWICQSLGIDKNCKDPRIYCAYCDMRNHPRFACKHVEKHRNPHKRTSLYSMRRQTPSIPLSKSTDQWRPRPAELVQAGVQEG